MTITILASTLLLTPVVTFGRCHTTGATQTEDDRAAKIRVGRVNLSSPVFHPDGSILESITVPPSNYTYGGVTLDTLLWVCDLNDVQSGSVKFLVATNADSRFGGEFELYSGGVYGTWFNHVGIKQVMSGVTLSRVWQEVTLQSYLPVGDKALIRLMDVPTLQVSLHYISSEVPQSGWYNCGGYPQEPSDTKQGINYACNQPSSYIQLYADGVAHDEPGEDHGDHHWDFWGSDNGFGYTLWNSATLSHNPTCHVESSTPHVVFPTTTVSHLESGGTVDSTFSVLLNCESDTISGTEGGETAIGFQVSQGSLSASKRLGLVSHEGTDYLLSDQYGKSPDIATGVGITIRDADGNQRRWVADEGVGSSSSYRGPLGGFHPISWGSRLERLEKPDGYILRLDFTASLQKLPIDQVRPGRVKSIASVIVRVQ